MSVESDSPLSGITPVLSCEAPRLQGGDIEYPSSARRLVLLAAFLGWMFDGLEMGIVPMVAPPALKELLHTNDGALIGQWMGYITAAFLLGAAAGGFVFGWLGDRFGRVRTMAFSVLTYSLFTGLGFFVHSAWQLAGLRFIAALGMGGEWALGVALVMECWPQEKRPMLAGAIGAASNVGIGLIAAIGLVFPIGEASWRWVMLAGAAPAILTFFIRLFVPESERWKQAVMKGPANPVREVFTPPLLKLTLLAIAFASIALVGTWGSVQWIPLWVDKLTLDPLTHHTDLRAKAWSQVVSSLGAIVGCLLGALAGGRAGRRITYFGLCALSLMLCAILFRGFHHYGMPLLGMIFLVGCSTAAFYGWMPLYLPELFPTRVRATGQGLGYNFGRVLAAVGALEMGALMSYFTGTDAQRYAHAASTVTLVYFLGLVLIWFAPETKGKPLPD